METPMIIVLVVVVILAALVIAWMVRSPELELSR
jgi:hypothetical protein